MMYVWPECVCKCALASAGLLVLVLGNVNDRMRIASFAIETFQFNFAYHVKIIITEHPQVNFCNNLKSFKSCVGL